LALFARRTPQSDDARNERASSGWTIKISISGLIDVPIEWYGTNLYEVRDTFIQFLEDGAAVRLVDNEQPNGTWRMVSFKDQGVPKILIFRADWVSGFTIES
jgi:hypothetical protein